MVMSPYPVEGLSSTERLIKGPSRRQATKALCAAPLLFAARPARAASFTDEQRRAVERILQREIDTGVVPGICWSIGTANETLAAGALGLKVVSPDAPMKAATRFALASVTKQFTSAALYLLQQKGIVSLDAPLADYLPTYRYAADLTLRQMLTMTSGISADMACEEPVDGRLDGASLLERLNMMDLISKPGEHFTYSNCAYDLAGVLVSNLSGMPYEALLEKEFFRPLGMVNTYRAGTRQDPDFAEGYQPKGKEWVRAPLTPADAEFASGNLVSNSADLQRWDRALLNASVLSRATLKEMFTVPTLTSGARNIYASGWFVEPTGVIWHGGSLDGYGNANLLVPQTGHAVTVLGNTAPHGRWKPQDIAQKIYNAAELGLMLPPFLPVVHTTLEN